MSQEGNIGFINMNLLVKVTQRTETCEEVRRKAFYVLRK